MTDSPELTKAASKPQGSASRERVSELERARSRSVRLVISIPVLTMLTVLGAGTVLYIYITRLAESPEILAETQLSLERAAIVIIRLSIMISLAAALLGYVLARQIVRPIRDLTDKMDAVTKGDLSTKVPPITLGEFGQLGLTFNRMMAQLNRLFEERDRQLHESLSGGHMIVDSEGNVIEADSAIRRILGANPSDLIGQNIVQPDGELPGIAGSRAFLDVLGQVLDSTVRGRPVSRAITLPSIKGGGEETRFLLSSLRLEHGHGGGAHVMLEIRDMSGIASFYEQIQRADRLAAVGTLATGIAHEIRNPLASIRGMMQLMGEMPEKTEITGEYHRRMLREVDRVEKLVSEIMDFAHTSEGPAEVFNIAELLQEVAATARHAVGEPADAVSIEWQLDPSLPPAVLRGERLRQAFNNLVVNAIQHCVDNRTEPVTIRTIYRESDQRYPLVVVISNPGKELDEAMRERIFEPFFTTKAEGTGLGLPIAYQMVQSNGGVLEVKCEGGKIEFWVLLPLDVESSNSSKTLRKIQLLGLGGAGGLNV